MIIVIELTGHKMPLMAPLGAAAFAVQQTDATATVIFRMLKKGEDGLDALNSAREASPMLAWAPVAARPENQVASTFSTDEYVAYDFISENGIWIAANVEVSTFLAAMGAIQRMPASPPKSLSLTAAALMKRLATDAPVKSRKQ